MQEEDVLDKLQLIFDKLELFNSEKNTWDDLKELRNEILDGVKLVFEYLKSKNQKLNNFEKNYLIQAIMYANSNLHLKYQSSFWLYICNINLWDAVTVDLNKHSDKYFKEEQLKVLHELSNDDLSNLIDQLSKSINN